jgi:phasin family protein
MTQINDHFEPLEKATHGMLKACEDATGLARDHMDAAVKSCSAISKGFEEISRNASDLLQESVARSINAGKTMMGAKNPREVMDLHNEFMRDVFDCWVAGTGRISEISARMTQEVMTPITEHANNALHKMTHKASSAA